MKYGDPSKELTFGDFSINPLSSKPSTSIIIAAKNEPVIIKNAVSGCLRSSYDNIKIFLVNVGSTDETGKVMNVLHRENPDKVKVIHIANNVGKRKAIVGAI